MKDPQGPWCILANASNSTMTNNDVINMDEPAYEQDGSTPILYPSDNFLTTEEGDTKYPDDYVINYYKYTNSPQTRIIPNVMDYSINTMEEFKQMNRDKE